MQQEIAELNNSEKMKEIEMDSLLKKLN